MLLTGYYSKTGEWRRTLSITVSFFEIGLSFASIERSVIDTNTAERGIAGIDYQIFGIRYRPSPDSNTQYLQAKLQSSEMTSSQEHCHGSSSEHEHDEWTAIERIYAEKSNEEESLIDWLTKNVDLYLSPAVTGGLAVSILHHYLINTIIDRWYQRCNYW